MELSKEGLTILYFGAPWCTPCKKLKPIIESVTEEKDLNTHFFDVSQEENENKMKKYMVRNVPTILFFKLGVLVERTSGSLTKPDFESLVEKFK